MDRGAWWATVHRVAKSRTWLNTHITLLLKLRKVRQLAPRHIPRRWFSKDSLPGLHALKRWPFPGLATSLFWGWSGFSSVAQSCLILCDPMDCSMTGLPVHRQLPEFTQTHVHWVGDTIQPSHSLSSPSPPDFNLSQHQDLLKWVSSLHQVAKVLEFQLQHQFFQWIFRTDFL